MICFRLSRNGMSLSTPSLGITLRSTTVAVEAADGAFNSLSRDHMNSSGFIVMFFHFTFNSLSRDHRDGRWLSASRSRSSSTFNSLSRDHQKPSGSPARSRSQLSTPSLGITRKRDEAPHHPTQTGSFQLPLSGSPEILRGQLSRRLHPFNSLSRDHVFAFAGWLTAWSRYFQLPLSGSHVMLRTRLIFSNVVYFQLPLSGSPSPIPGFFGSPRLSAAAPLRTNES